VSLDSKTEWLHSAHRKGDNCDVLIERMQRALEKRIVLANAIAALFVTAYLLATSPARPSGITVTESLIIGVVQFVVGVGVLAFGAVRMSRRIAARDAAWVAEERPPTPHERKIALDVPWRMGVLPMPFWTIAAVTIAAWPNTGTTVDRLRIFVGIVLGGVLSCGLTYALVDRANDELRAAALAGAAPDDSGRIGIRTTLLLAWGLGSAIPLIGIALTPAIRSTDAVVPLAVPVVVLAVAGLIAGLVLIQGSAGAVSKPMSGLRAAFERVQQGDLDASLTVDASGEIGMVQAGFNQMVAGLREREQLRDLFGRHVGEEVARAAMEQGASLGGESREASVFFIDLIGSSTLARETSANEVVALLNRFFAAVVHAADSEGGWVNKFEGDAALCVFGAPNHQPDHAARALRAARSLRDSLDGIEAAIGVSSGTVVAGNVGSEARYEYTVIGHPVNEAARLTDEAKKLDTRILASDSVVAAAREEKANWRAAGTYELRGTGRTDAWTA
jgi:adenylate cyclase